MSSMSHLTADLRTVDDKTLGHILDALDEVMEAVRARDVRAITIAYDRELFDTGDSPLWSTWAPGVIDIRVEVDRYRL